MKHKTLKLLSLLLAAALCCSACGTELLSRLTSAADESSESSIAAATTAAAGTTAAQEASSAQTDPAAATTAAAGEAVTPSCLTLQLQESSQSYYSEAVTSLVALGKTVYPVLSEESAAACPALKTALDSYAKTLMDESETGFEAIRQQADVNLQMARDMGAYHCYGNVGITRADTLAFSLIHSVETVNGGMLPTTVLSALTLSSQTGKALTLQEVFKDTSLLPAQLLTALKASYPQEDWTGMNTADVLSRLLSEDSLVWTLGYEAVSFYFTAGQIAPVSSGEFTVSLDFASHKNDIIDTWLSAPAAYMQSFLTLNSYSSLLSGTGKGDLFLECACSDYEISHFDLKTGAGSLSADCTTSSLQAFLMHSAEGQDYLYLQMEGYSDDQELRVIVLYDSQAPTELAELYYGMKMAVSTGADVQLVSYLCSPDSFPLTQRSDRFGTFKTIRSYYLDSTGLPESREAWSSAVVPISVTLKSALRVSLLDKTTGETIGAANLTAGTALSLTAIRGDEVQLSLSDGRVVTLTLEKLEDSYEYGVAGVPISQLFDGIVYAD